MWRSPGAARFSDGGFRPRRHRDRTAGPGHRPSAARHAAGAGSDDEGVQQTRGDVLIAPITQGGDLARNAGFAVPLTRTGCKTQGVALVNKIRMFDPAARKVERAPQEVIDDALGRLMALLN